MTTQIEWVKTQLEKYGEVSRNQALQNFISRLGAIVYILKNQGFDFKTEWRGNDYFYVLSSKPTPPPKPVRGFVIIDGERKLV